MNLRMRSTRSLILLLCCLPVLLGTDIYRWVDANGVVNYSQQAPIGIPAERVAAVSTSGRSSDPGIGSGAAADAALAAATEPALPATDPALSDAQAAALDRLRAADAARQVEFEALRAANCARARGVLERLTASGRIRVRAEDGAQAAMPEEERQARIAEAQRGVAENCDG
jgi:hypothetical protein